MFYIEAEADITPILLLQQHDVCGRLKWHPMRVMVLYGFGNTGHNST